MNNIRNSIQAALDLMGEAKFVKAAEILFSVLAQTDGDDADAIIIQYHEATIKRLEKRVIELELALSQRRFIQTAYAQSESKPLTYEEINEIGNGLNGIYPPISRQRRDLLLVRKAEAAHGIEGGKT